MKEGNSPLEELGLPDPLGNIFFKELDEVVESLEKVTIYKQEVGEGSGGGELTVRVTREEVMSVRQRMQMQNPVDREEMIETIAGERWAQSYAEAICGEGNQECIDAVARRMAESVVRGM